jgi:hypothetical protein
MERGASILGHAVGTVAGLGFAAAVANDAQAWFVGVSSAVTSAVVTAKLLSGKGGPPPDSGAGSQGDGGGDGKH